MDENNEMARRVTRYLVTKVLNWNEEEIKQNWNNSLIAKYRLRGVLKHRYGNSRVNWEKERTDFTTQEEIEGKNRLNIELFNHLGENRDQIFFSNTTLFCTVKALNSCDRKPTSTLKFFSI